MGNPMYQSKYAPNPPPRNDPPNAGVNRSLPTSLNIDRSGGQADTLTKAESTPFLAPHSSGASSEMVSSEKSLAVRDSFKKSVHQKASEAFKATTSRFKAPHASLRSEIHHSDTILATMSALRQSGSQRSTCSLDTEPALDYAPCFLLVTSSYCVLTFSRAKC
jgi:hypothetical protein